MILLEVTELALRATALGCLVWLGLTLARVRNPRLLMAVWTVVLAGALAMPAFEPWVQLTLPARLLPEEAWSARPMLPPPAEAPFVERASPARSAAGPVLGPAQDLAAEPAATRGHSPDWLWWATAAYLLVAAAMMMRLLIGITVMCRITAEAKPIGDGARGLAKVRLTDVVRVPVTFASFVLLPANSLHWSDDTRRIVLLHEGVHVARRDFYRLLAASLYRAAFWFSPFAWWLQHRLADLAEMISDDAVVAEIGDRSRYADLLLEMAGIAPAPPSGLAMAQADSVPRRVKRILAMRVPPVAISRRTCALTAVTVLPLAVICAGSVTFETVRPAGAPQRAADALRATIPAVPLDRFVGDYQIGVGSLLTIMRDGQQLSARLIGEPTTRLRAVSDHEFVSEQGSENLTFVSDGDGRIAGIELRSAAGRLERGSPIDAPLARQIESRFAQRIAAAPDRFVRQAPAAGGADKLRAFIAELQHGLPDYRQMSPQLARQMRARAPLLHESLSRLGEVRAISFHGVGPGGYDIYAVGFANGSAEFRLDLAADGTLDDITFHPEGDGRPGDILGCERQDTLQPAADTAPIRLSLINHSGGGIRLFRLGVSGWLAGGALDDGLSTDVLTDVSQPLMIADRDGRCHEIILPGRSTRMHVVESDRAGVAGQIERELPANGSYEALQNYIAGVRSGELNEDLLTPQAAAAARPLQKQRQAILARLGQELVASFRSVSRAGGDIYHVRFANGEADWQIAVTAHGQISSVALLP
jgi:hypothetical protein